ARLAEARQPQTTKHLQALERAGVVASERSGQRRIYTLRPGPLRDLAAALTGLADDAEAVGGAGEAFDRRRLSVQAERLAADAPGWADGREFGFTRSLPGPVELVWRHLTEAELLARWWTPDDLRISELVFEARPGGRIVHEYRDAEDLDGSDAVVGRAEGAVTRAVLHELLSYRLSPLLPGGGTAFTADVEYGLRPLGGATELDVRYRVGDSSVESADFIAGIETGFGQSLEKLAALIASHTSNAVDDGAEHRNQE
ncbi:SRPBCC domain-containing protein, partial [Glycomyces tenuis]